MYTEETLGIIKPHLSKSENIDDIIEEIETYFEKTLKIKDFEIEVIGTKLLTKKEAAEFYKEHSAKPFFPQMLDFMTQDEATFFILTGENIISEYRKFLGATNPKEAAPGTLRHKYGVSIDENGFHGSDSEESADREIDLILSIFE